jgi:hypothetical protein
MPSFKEYKSVIEIPKLVSLDIIDLNKRLRKRKNRTGTNLWDILPDDVIPHIVKHKIKLDFDKNWDYDFVVSKYNCLYDHSTLKHIAINILDNKKWDWESYLYEQTKCQSICDVYFDEYTDKLIFDFLITKLQDDIENNLNFEYLNYFKEYTKKEEVILKRFDVGKTYYRTFKNKETNETIKIPFTIIEREDIVSIGFECKAYITAVVDGTDIKVRLCVNYEIDRKKNRFRLYLNEYTEISLGLNKDLQKYLEDNNLKVIRYRINA